MFGANADGPGASARCFVVPWRLSALLRVHVAAEDHQRLDGFGHEGGCLVHVRERVGARPRRLGIPCADRIDLGLDHARVAVVDGAQDGDRASVASRVPDEQLAGCGRSAVGCELAHVPWAALWAACATVSLSAKPPMRIESVLGRV